MYRDFAFHSREKLIQVEAGDMDRYLEDLSNHQRPRGLKISASAADIDATSPSKIRSQGQLSDAIHYV